ncbi:MAG TPA: hypothetical protein VMR97_06955 [Acidimicrobiales bacterium]|nr:hypothetical protein [Acidimicrobiales bacterium]
MGLFDTLLGRTKPVRANLDNLFALPGAAVTLQVSAGLLPTRRAGVCFKPPAGQPFAEMQAQVEQLLAMPDEPQPGDAQAPAGAGASGGAGGASKLTVRHVGDSFGYRWILVEGGEIDDLVTRVHMVHSSLEDAGWSTQLLCSVFGFGPGQSPGPDSGSEAGAPVALEDEPPSGDATVAVDRPVYLVYLAKRGTFYPFAPSGKEQRDTELELRLRSILGTDLPIEGDLSSWFPIWDLPIA